MTILLEPMLDEDHPPVERPIRLTETGIAGQALSRHDSFGGAALSYGGFVEAESWPSRGQQAPARLRAAGSTVQIWKLGSPRTARIDPLGSLTACVRGDIVVSNHECAVANAMRQRDEAVRQPT